MDHLLAKNYLLKIQQKYFLFFLNERGSKNKLYKLSVKKMQMSKLWKVGSLYNYSAYRSFTTLSLSLSAIPASASALFVYCKFDHSGMLERQNFCQQKQKSCCNASFRLRGTVTEYLTFNQRVPTLMIASLHRAWHFALRLALCISLIFCGWSETFIDKVVTRRNSTTCVSVQTYYGFCCEQLK